MTTETRLLVVDEDPALVEHVLQTLGDEGYHVTRTQQSETALGLFERELHPVVILAHSEDGHDTLDLLRQIKSRNSDTQVILSAVCPPPDSIVDAVQEGACDLVVRLCSDSRVVIAKIKSAALRAQELASTRALLDQFAKRTEELEGNNKTLKDMAVRDGLTALYNHRFFHENHAAELARSRRYGREFSLVFLDIDYFKCYNDTHGHPKGDQLLAGFAALLASRIRQSDIACRYGGEEFVLLLPETSKRGALTVAESIRMQVESQEFEGRHTQPNGRITVSTGVATYPEDGRDTRTLLDNVDRALYRAKRHGRNKVCDARECVAEAPHDMQSDSA